MGKIDDTLAKAILNRHANSFITGSSLVLDDPRDIDVIIPLSSLTSDN